MQAGTSAPWEALTKAEKAVLENKTTYRSIKINNKEMQITKDDRQYWAFRPIRKPIVPTVNNAYWAQNEIDLFILSYPDFNPLYARE